MLFWPVIGEAITTDEQGFYLEPGETHGRLLEPNPERRFVEAPEAPIRSSKQSKGENVPTQHLGTVGAVERLVEAEFGKGHIMYWVAANESQFSPTAASGTGPKGVFQIANQTWSGYHCKGNVYNAYDNIQCARKIYDANGLTDWRWSKYHGAYGGWARHL